MGANLIAELEPGLILRRATVADAEPMAAFQADVHREPDAGGPEERVGAWVIDLMTREHPTFDPSDFTVVEHVETGAIVSALCLIGQTWRYDAEGAEVEFDVGRVEFVGRTDDPSREVSVPERVDFLVRRYRFSELVRNRFEKIADPCGRLHQFRKRRLTHDQYMSTLPKGLE